MALRNRRGEDDTEVNRAHVALREPTEGTKGDDEHSEETRECNTTPLEPNRHTACLFREVKYLRLV